MKRTILCITAAIIAALAVGAIAGCSSQSSAPSPEDLIAELKDAITSGTAFDSVTVTERTQSVATGAAEEEADEAASEEAESAEAESAEAESAEAESAEAESEEADSIESMTVYKFDKSGDQVKTCMTSTYGDLTLQYFSDGDDAVCVTDGPVYSGTVEQFELPCLSGFEAFLADTYGDLNSVLDCFSNITKEEADGVTTYTVELDPEKYIASDEILTMLADSGEPVQESVYTFGFDKDGHLVKLSEVISYADFSTSDAIELADFDSTVIDPMPEANRTYEQMEQDIDAKYAVFESQMDLAERFAGQAEAVEEAVEAK